MTFVDPGVIGECDARTQGGRTPRGYGSILSNRS
jgi:hypothetical protein